MEVTIHEEKFMDYKIGLSGSFKQSLYDTFFKGDTENRKKLISAFPELEVAHKYASERGYWQDLVDRYNKKYNTKYVA